MSTKKLIFTIALKLVIFISIMAVVFTISNSIGVIINNNIALGQMENNNETFMLMELYNNIVKPITIIVSIFMTLLCSILIGMDVYKLYKK
jgi:hypothetical protein